MNARSSKSTEKLTNKSYSNSSRNIHVPFSCPLLGKGAQRDNLERIQLSEEKPTAWKVTQQTQSDSKQSSEVTTVTKPGLPANCSWDTTAGPPFPLRNWIRRLLR